MSEPIMTESGSIAAALARAWVRLYTRGTPADLRDARRVEIEADLWEHQQDARHQSEPRAAVAAEILLRTLLGIPDDLGWRFEVIQAGRGPRTLERREPMAISLRRVHWMGLLAMLGALLGAGTTVLDVALGHPGRIYTSESSWHLGGTAGTVMMATGAIYGVLAALGVVALYLLQRGRLGKAAIVGFVLLLAAFVSTMLGTAVVPIFFGLSGFGGVLLTALVLPSELLLMPLGWVLLGIGTIRARQIPDPFRYLPLFIGCYLVATTAVGFAAVALRDRFPWAPILYRSDSPLGIAKSILLALALALVWYSVWSAARPGREPAASA